MRLTAHTDYALRVLIALVALRGEQRVTIQDLARRHRVSANHLMKVVRRLVQLGLVRGARGRTGGLTLAVPADQIRMGKVVRSLETDTQLVACLGDDTAASCVFTGVCGLTGALRGALDAFFTELDRMTLADLAQPREVLQERLGYFSATDAAVAR
jgi:Rrf2 family nitric oxide-sensitive transcriptional repressor